MRHLDLFSGIGGFALAARRVGWQTVAFCEIDPYCHRVLAKHWPGVPCYKDIRDVTAERLRTDGIIRPDVVTGGFPCQDISLAGKQAGIDGERSGLWSELARVLGEARPRFAIVENVPTLLSGDRGRWFGRVLGDLAEIGFDAEWHCIPASHIGAPHRRDRVWIIATPRDPDSDSESVGTVDDEASELSSDVADTIAESNWWTTEPDVGRVVDGIPSRVDRLRSLGNAIVPQVAEVIFRAVNAEARRADQGVREVVDVLSGAGR